ncbi:MULTISPECIES: helix-turn-helix domain-containing protein [unclassified Streptomyces]|uniref:helix-turn-helix domain-containing protein n=1 Tax=unclassified Streptomyces TaxID=2593676 RepID=UPI000DAE51A8|nr:MULTISPECIES: helix-turn-helix transcriptional regulator [unclassified Streptomyces]PZT76380.1 transcriptional regulator [Streptomyces sp. AC1-42W]PZT79666.1 transcriptional regulator [Streptomyces sp. AC1-42T]
MSARRSPTERQKRLGAELRRMRMSGSLSAESAASLLGVDRPKISNIEAGTRPISAERLRELALNCGCTDETYVDGLVELAQPSGRGWWEGYRGSLPPGLLDIAELESSARRMRAAYPLHIPGLLQIAEHALALFRVVIPRLPEEAVRQRLLHRVERQEVLDGDAAPPYTSIIHEAALRTQFGGPAVARSQLDHLLKKSEQPNVTVLVIPFEAGAFPGAGQTVLYAEGPVPRLDTVQIDNSHGPLFLHEEAQLAKYRAHLDWMENIALPPERTRDFIHAIARQL